VAAELVGISANSVLDDAELENLRTRAEMMANANLFAALRRWEAGDDRAWSSREDEYAAYQNAMEQEELLGAEVDAVMERFEGRWSEPPDFSEPGG
jgi:hypothetical protein